MITEPTVFVLGAGASRPYRYPTGAELRDEILKNFRGEFSVGFSDQNAFIDKWEVPVDVAQEEAAKFVKRFDKSNMSIDIFLTRHQGNVWISRMGKLTIILRILAAERSHEKNGAEDEQRAWYKFLLEKLLDGLNDKDDFIKRFSNNRVTIVTFNYDRSLDYVLFDSVFNGFEAVTSDEVAEQMRHIPIVHMHGQVMYLPWQNPGVGVWSFSECGGRNWAEYDREH